MFATYMSLIITKDILKLFLWSCFSSSCIFTYYFKVFCTRLFFCNQINSCFFTYHCFFTTKSTLVFYNWLSFCNKIRTCFSYMIVFLHHCFFAYEPEFFLRFRNKPGIPWYVHKLIPSIWAESWNIAQWPKGKKNIIYVLKTGLLHI